jgi:hypothetical protein
MEQGMTKPRDEDHVPHTYIGDGLYAEFTGFDVRLYTQEGNQVFLERDAMKKLNDWLKQEAGW